MGTKQSKDSVDIGIQTTVMAIREEVMKYFKGTCIKKLTNGVNVQRRTVEPIYTDRQYQYQRRQAEQEHHCMIWVSHVPILSLKHAPDRIIFHDTVLNRSPQLRKVKDGVEDFMERFLIGVEKEYSNANKF